MSKTLKNVLDKNVNVPKSYTRYLTCPIVDTNDNEIHVETPKGTTVIFKIENDSLKRIGSLSAEESSASIPTPDETSEDGKNVMFISLQEWNDIQKKWENTQSLVAEIEELKQAVTTVTKIEERIAALEKKPGDVVGKLAQIEERITKIESRKTTTSDSKTLISSNFEEKLIALEERIAKIESRPSFIDKNKKYVEQAIGAAKKSESIQKAKEKSKGIMVVSLAFLWKSLVYLFKNPKISVPMVIIVAIVFLKPWQYLPSGQTSNNNNNSSIDPNANYINYDNKDLENITVNTSKEDYIIPKNKVEENSNSQNQTNTNTTSTNQVNNALLEAKEKEYREWAQQEEALYLAAQRKMYNIPHLQEWLDKAKSSIEENRIEAARELANSDDSEAGGPLLKMLADPSEGVRWQAIRGIGKLEYDLAAYGLLKIIENKREKINLRIEAMLSASRLRTTKTVYVLRKILVDQKEDVEIRANVIESLGLIGDANVSVDILNTLTTSKEKLLQQASIRALGRFGYPAAYTVIVDLLNSTDDIEMKIECIKALGGITNKATKIVPTLVELWETGDYDLKESLKESLSSLLPYLDGTWKEKVADIVE